MAIKIDGLLFKYESFVFSLNLTDHANFGLGRKYMAQWFNTKSIVPYWYMERLKGGVRRQPWKKSRIGWKGFPVERRELLFRRAVELTAVAQAMEEARSAAAPSAVPPAPQE